MVNNLVCYIVYLTHSYVRLLCNVQVRCVNRLTRESNYMYMYTVMYIKFCCTVFCITLEKEKPYFKFIQSPVIQLHRCYIIGVLRVGPKGPCPPTH